MSTTVASPEPAAEDAPGRRTGVSALPRVGVVGTGYVGLPLAIALARLGHPVRGFDRSDEQRAIAAEHAAAAGFTVREFDAVADPRKLAGCEIFIITVPTPTDDGQPDLQYVETACASVGAAMARGALIILESTVAPGTTRGVCLPILETVSGLTAGADFLLAYSPERINPGDSEHQLGNVPKVVAGLDTASLEAAADLYSGFTTVYRAPSIEVAELAKLVENTQRDVNIAFANEVSNLARALGLSTREVLDVAATKWNFLPFEPGVVGGHCIAEDPHYVIAAAASVGVSLPTVAAARATNVDRVERVAELVASLQPDPLDGPVIIYGAAYKANVTDRRNSAATQLERALGALGYRVIIIDPLVDGELAFRRRAAEIQAEPTRLVVAAVIHDRFAREAAEHIRPMLGADGSVLDLSGSLLETDFERFARLD